jgi:xylan 1,4-beta-xylosidase
MNINGIRKPAWFAYKYLHALRGNAVPTADPETWAASDGKHIVAVIWDWVQPDQTLSDRPYYTKEHPSVPERPARVTFEHLKPGRYTLTVHRTGFEHNDPQTAFLEMGSPAKLTSTQLAELQRLTRDLPEIRRVVRVASNGRFAVTIPMRSNDVVLAEMDAQTR